jgi:hypothetical protein
MWYRYRWSWPTCFLVFFSPPGHCRYSALNLIMSVWDLLAMLVFWVVPLCGLVGTYRHLRGTYCHFIPEDARSIFLRNIGICLQVHSAYNRREQYRHVSRLRLSTSNVFQPWARDTSVNRPVTKWFLLNDNNSISGRSRLFSVTTSEPVLWSTQPLYPVGNWGFFSRGSNFLESETDNSSSAEIKNVWSFTSIKPYVFATWHLSTVTTLTIVVPFEAVWPSYFK